METGSPKGGLINATSQNWRSQLGDKSLQMTSSYNRCHSEDEEDPFNSEIASSH
jgi:hypothetical protein